MTLGSGHMMDNWWGNSGHLWERGPPVVYIMYKKFPEKQQHLTSLNTAKELNIFCH